MKPNTALKKYGKVRYKEVSEALSNDTMTTRT
jgi:hypothetical protein